MKRSILLITGIFPILINAQIDIGKYRLCFEMYWKCHTAIIFDLNEDRTYKFRLQDDTSVEETHGNWEISDSLVFFYPKTIPDTIQTTIFETKLSKTARKSWWELTSKTTKEENDNLLVINKYFNKPLSFKETWIKQKGNWSKKITDESGCIFYEGEIADSIKLKVDSREFKWATTKKERPSLIRITIREDYKDLIYRTLIFNYIRIEKGKMFIDIIEEDRPLKRLYFEKIKSEN